LGSSSCRDFQERVFYGISKGRIRIKIFVSVACKVLARYSFRV
jgi:hypothetical protein